MRNRVEWRISKLNINFRCCIPSQAQLWADGSSSSSFLNFVFWYRSREGPNYSPTHEMHFRLYFSSSPCISGFPTVLRMRRSFLPLLREWGKCHCYWSQMFSSGCLSCPRSWWKSWLNTRVCWRGLLMFCFHFTVIGCGWGLLKIDLVNYHSYLLCRLISGVGITLKGLFFIFASGLSRSYALIFFRSFLQFLCSGSQQSAREWSWNWPVGGILTPVRPALPCIRAVGRTSGSSVSWQQ